ncbi:MAG TPA: HEAT repeat domain-containing protein [Phycisphaerae bacterium]|nr:HEAT repeat domain-containing protein [Phycisphaerae bacterium]
MNASDQAAATRLLVTVEPFETSGDLTGLTRVLRDDWTPECLMPFLTAGDEKVERTAALCLGLIGDSAACQALVSLLHHSSAVVVATAEQALWTIWFRAGGQTAQAVLCKIIERMYDRETDNAVPMLTELIRAFPHYAEAHHQRAQASFLQSAYASALRDARKAHRENPFHFGALATQGHALAALGHRSEALAIYREVLMLHPRCEGIEDAIGELRGRADRAEIRSRSPINSNGVRRVPLLFVATRPQEIADETKG